MTSHRMTSAVTLVLAFAIAIAGCSSASPTTAPTGDSYSSGPNYPVSVENCGRTLTFDAAPEHVVSLWQAPTEMFIALGLEDHLVAMAGNYAPFPDSIADAASGVPEIGTAMGWPSREMLLSQGADLVIGQSLVGYAFDTSQGSASVEQIEDSGAQVYGANLCDADQAETMTLDTPIQTIRDLGTIFDVRDRAEALIAEMEAHRQLVVDAVAHVDSVDVAFYNGGEGPLIVLAGGIYDDAIATAGGQNVFPAGAVFVSKEEFAAADPDVILIGTYDGQDFATLRAYLEATFPELAAVQQGNLVEIPVADTDASFTVMRGLTEIANALHPELGLAVPSS